MVFLDFQVLKALMVLLKACRCLDRVFSENGLHLSRGCLAGIDFRFEINLA